jgi:dTDP-4-dehydrorhamnose 3,5-epimerase
MQIERLNIPDVFVLTPTKYHDHRGFFSEVYRREALVGAGVSQEFVQENHVYSAKRGIVRGLHFQAPPHAQGKLVRCIRGTILDVAVDIRKGSPFFSSHVAVELSATSLRQLWLPPGFAHGYVTLEEGCEVVYKVTNYWAPDYERGIVWNDPSLGIDWRISEADAVLADKDQSYPFLADLPPFFHYSSGIS